MRTCPNCRHIEPIAEAEFCGLCGARLRGETRESPAPRKKVSPPLLIAAIVGTIVIVAVVITVSLKSASAPPASLEPAASTPVDPGYPGESVVSPGPSGETPTPNPEAGPDDGDGIYYTVQVGSFIDRTNAENLKNTLIARSEDAYIEEFPKDGTTFWRVRVGTFPTRERADRKGQDLAASGYPIFVTKK